MFRARMIVFFLVGLLVCSGASASEDEQCANLVSTRCETCHYMTRICERLGNKSRSSWKRTVSNMVLYGAQLNQDEKQQLVECLSIPSADVKDLCKK